MKNFFSIISTLAFVTPMAVAPSAVAQENFPDRPITFIMGWSAGGMGDTMVRLFLKSAEKELGQPVVVVNRPGAAGSLGLDAVMQAKPDGYTIGYSASSNYLIGAVLRNTPQFENSTQIACFYDYSFGLAVRTDAPWNTWNEFKEYSKKNPGKASYSTAGTGTMHQLTMERIAMKEGIKWTHVPFKGGNDATLALLGGHVNAVSQGPTDIIPFVKDGRLKMLLVLDEKRWESAPNVPTILEAGYDFWAVSKQCIHGPKGLPERIRAKLEAVFERASRDPEVVNGAKARQASVSFMGGKEYTKFISDRIEAFRTIIKALDLPTN